jgi:ABC-type nitrate/sulfonate/bicarbonate transport system substrate-binding protein
MVPKVLGLLLLALTWSAIPAYAADPVRLGLLHTLSPAPFYIAQERGYFHDEGINLSFRFFAPPSRLPPRRWRGMSISASLR